uniref:Uncharacterized protein n=1 Tax=Rhizophagus irregularis (strain DAOM 181602 / DAOM 197198 / MUCL 43194) TaxID=747089 RepID=U9TVT6_RHIID
MCFIGKNNDLDMFNDMEEKCPTLRIFLRKDKIIKPIGLICRKGIQNIKNGDSTFHFSFIHPDYGIIKIYVNLLTILLLLYISYPLNGFYRFGKNILSTFNSETKDCSKFFFT